MKGSPKNGEIYVKACQFFFCIFCFFLFLQLVSSNGLVYAGPLDSWTQRTISSPPTITQLRECTFGYDKFVCVGDPGIIVTSPDGVTPWTVRNSGTSVNLSGVVYGNGKFVVVGYGPTILTSLDGITWTSQSPPVGLTDNLERVGFGNGLFVAIGDRRAILISTDGISWTRRTLVGVNPEYGIAYGNGVWIAVGRNARIWRSADNGVTWCRIWPLWTPTPCGPTDPIIPVGALDGNPEFRRIAFGNNVFVAVGDQSTIMTSPDGLYWTKQTVPNPPGAGQSFRGVRYGDGSFVVTGYSGIILTSPDGVTWTQKTSGTSLNLRGVGFGITASGNGSFVIGGDNNPGPPWVILQSGTFTAPGPPTGVTAVAGNAQATISFTVPASDGGSPINLYTVTSTPGGITATGTSSPITVTGLTNGTTYTFTVKATNSIGTGPESAPSNSVTPDIVPSGTHSPFTVNLGDGVIVTFSQITGPCSITKTTASSPPGPAPSGYQFLGTFYDIVNSGCPTSGPITVTVPYNESSVPVAETSLKLFHWETSTWHDVTYSIDTGNNTITGQVTSLSPFGAGYPFSGGGGGGGYSTGANENMIALIAILAISSGVVILRKRKRDQNIGG
jgi:LPXTG-motif cell wall-anchored protein